MRLLVAWLHLGVLWTFAVSQPLFGVLSDSPEFFVARGNTSGDIVLLALVLVLVPPTLLIGVEALLLPFERARRYVHLLFVAGLTAALAAQILVDAIDVDSGLFLLLVGAIGIAGAVAYALLPPTRTFLTVLAPAPALFLVLFLFFSPVSDLVIPSEPETARGAAGNSQTPVILVVFDEFSSASLMNARHEIDASRFPGFAELAEHSTWYRNAATISGDTTKAVPAILTGRYAREGALPIASDHPGSVFTLVGNRYDLDVTEEVTHICPQRLCGDRSGVSAGERRRALLDDLSVVVGHMVLPQDLRDRLPAVDRGFQGFRGGGQDTGATAGDIPGAALASRDAQFQSFVDSIRSDRRRPSLHFIHSALPHVPWQYLPSGQRYAITGREMPGLTEEQWADDRAVVDQARARYLLQVGFVDRLIKRLVARLRKTGVWDRAMVVVTADHGVSFQPGGSRRAPGKDNLAEIAGVPLFVKLPRQEQGRIADTDVRTIDIVPTIAHALDLTIPWDVDGRPASEIPAGSDRKRPLIDEAITFDLDQFEAARDVAVRRQLSFIGAGRGFGGVFTGGPNGDLVGRSAGALDGAALTGARVELNGPQLLENVDPAAETVPTFITGRVDGADPGVPVAVAVNGTIRATTSTFEDQGSTQIAAMVPPSALSRGKNVVDVYAIQGTGAGRRLARLTPTRRETYGLYREGDDLLLLSSSGKRIPVTGGAAQGYVDVANVEERSVAGWAASGDGEQPADLVVAFENSRFLAAGRPSNRRDDLVETIGPGAREAGFALAPPGAFDLQALRVFGIVGDRATELEGTG